MLDVCHSFDSANGVMFNIKKSFCFTVGSAHNTRSFADIPLKYIWNGFS